MKLTFGFSPCPNDTFMFDAIFHQKIDLMGIKFEVIMDDVEHLNKLAINHQTDVTKLSFNAFTKVYDRYQMLTSGSALGNNCGPLLIAKNEYTLDKAAELSIGVPGYNTTAFLLLKYTLPKADYFKEYVFSDIEKAVLNGEVYAGLIIHENRFTYQQKGLQKLIDLGEYWERETQSPIPLGGIAIKKSIPDDIKKKVNQILYNSVKYAFEHPEDTMPFVAKYAQELEPEVMKAHIDLYVNRYSQDLGPIGKQAVFTLFKVVHPELTDTQLEALFVK